MGTGAFPSKGEVEVKVVVICVEMEKNAPELIARSVILQQKHVWLAMVPKSRDVVKMMDIAALAMLALVATAI